jgi:hypothetical protein
MEQQLNIEETLRKRDLAEFEHIQEQKQKDFFELHAKVKDHMLWDDVQTKDWFYRKNPKIGDFTPLDYYGKQPNRCIAWVNLMIEDGIDL